MADTVGKLAEDFARELQLASDDCLNESADRNPIIRNLLLAVDKALRLAEEDHSARRYLHNRIDDAVSRMVREIRFVRVWNASPLHVAVDRLSLPMRGESLRVFPNSADSMGTSDTTTSTGTVSTGNSSVPDEVAALMDGGLEALDLICPAGLSVLHEIAQRLIRVGPAGYTKHLQDMEFASCDVLDRFLTILVHGWSWRGTEIWTKRWSMVTKLVEKAVVAMRRQLYAQDSGAFEDFRDIYLVIIAENRVLHLLGLADLSTPMANFEELVHIILGMYVAVSDAAHSLLLLFSGAHKLRVSKRIQGILTNLVKTMVRGVMANINKRDPAPSTGWAPGGGVHQVTQYAMSCVERLAPHRTGLGLILASGGVDIDAPAGGAKRCAKRVTSFGSVVENLVDALECNLESAPIWGGLKHLFLAINISFVLDRAEDADVLYLLGDEWAARRRSLLERHVASYVQAYWGPVVACLMKKGGASKALTKFNAEFKKMHDYQGRSKVPDPKLRAALRNAVSETVVPAYKLFLQKHQKHPKLIYSVDHLTGLLSELFEG